MTSSEESDASLDFDDDTDIRFDDLLHEGESSGVGTWTYNVHSDRGSKIAGKLKTDVYSKHMQLKKAQKEIKKSLSKAREKLFDVDEGQQLTPMSAFAASLPEDYMKFFSKWTRAVNPRYVLHVCCVVL